MIRQITSSVILLSLTTVIVNSLNKDNVCVHTEKYNVTLERYYPKNVTVREFVWCKTFPFRCSQFKTFVKNYTKIEIEEREREVEHCCPGYEKSSSGAVECHPVCEEECLNGICIGPNLCSCFPGYTGNICQEECPLGTWDIGCSKKCECKHESFCDRRSGKCICPPEWTGPLCDIPLPITTPSATSTTQTPSTTSTPSTTTTPSTTSTQITTSTSSTSSPSTTTTTSIPSTTNTPSTTITPSTPGSTEKIERIQITEAPVFIPDYEETPPPSETTEINELVPSSPQTTTRNVKIDQRESETTTVLTTLRNAEIDLTTTVQTTLAPVHIDLGIPPEEPSTETNFNQIDLDDKNIRKENNDLEDEDGDVQKPETDLEPPQIEPTEAPSPELNLLPPNISNSTVIRKKCRKKSRNGTEPSSTDTEATPDLENVEFPIDSLEDFNEPLKTIEVKNSTKRKKCSKKHKENLLQVTTPNSLFDLTTKQSLLKQDLTLIQVTTSKSFWFESGNGTNVEQVKFGQKTVRVATILTIIPGVCLTIALIAMVIVLTMRYRARKRVVLKCIEMSKMDRQFQKFDRRSIFHYPLPDPPIFQNTNFELEDDNIRNNKKLNNINNLGPIIDLQYDYPKPTLESFRPPEPSYLEPRRVNDTTQDTEPGPEGAEPISEPVYDELPPTHIAIEFIDK